MPRPPRVLVSFFWDMEALRRGVVRYAREHGWELVSDSPSARQPVSDPVDGVIGMLSPEPDHPTRVRAAESGVPVAEMSLAYPENKDWIRCPEDCGAIGLAAAEHLRRLPVKSFAFFDDTPWWNHDARFEALKRGLGNDVRPLRRFHLRNAGDWSANPVGDYLRELPKPCGVFGAVDSVARQVADAATAAGHAVPGDFYIMGFGDRDLHVEGPGAPITSIPLDWEKWAYGTAALLDEAMRGRVAPGTVRPFPPGKIIVRESTGGDSSGDPLCARAVALMRENIAAPLNVKDIAARLSVSLSSLERAFDTRLGTGVGRRYLELRMEIARGLLASGEKAEFVAAEVGYASYRAFAASFRNITGMSPGEVKRGDGPGCAKSSKPAG